MSILSGYFPTHARHPALADTPSSGVSECLKVLRRIDLRRLGVTRAEVKRALQIPARGDTAAAVGSVLDTISSTYVTKVGSGASATYKLTRAGLKYAQRTRPRALTFPFNTEMTTDHDADDPR